MSETVGAMTSSELLKGSWDIFWAVAGCGVVYACRDALRRPSDGRVAWTAKPEVMYGYIILYFVLVFTVLGGLSYGITKSIAPYVSDSAVFERVMTGFLITFFSSALLLFIRGFLPDFAPQRPHRVAPAPTFGFTPAGLLRGFAVAMAVVFVSSLGWNGVLMLVRSLGGGDYLEKQSSVELIKSLSGWHELSPFLLGTVVFAPLNEELFYRGGLFAMLRGKMGRLGAVALSGLIFGLVHGNVAAMIPLTLFGMWLAYLYDSTADLRVPIVIHALFNLNTVCWVLFAPETLV